MSALVLYLKTAICIVLYIHNVKHHMAGQLSEIGCSCLMCLSGRTDIYEDKETIIPVKAPKALSGTLLRQLNKIYSCYGSRQTLTSPSDSVLCQMRIALAGFLIRQTLRWWSQSLLHGNWLWCFTYVYKHYQIAVFGYKLVLTRERLVETKTTKSICVTVFLSNDSVW